MTRRRARNAPRRAIPAQGQGAQAPGPPPESGQAQAGPPTPRAYRRRLKTLAHVRRELADTVREVKTATLDLGRGRVLVYGLSVLASVIKDDAQLGELTQRILRLEELMAGRNGASGSLRPAPAPGDTKGAQA